MEIRKGYQQTEIGLIPEDWEVKKLGELGVFKKGKGIKKDQVLGDGIACVRYGEIYTHHNNIVRKFNSFISEAIASQSQKLRKGDLLFAGSGETADEIGKCVAFLDDFEAYAGGDVIILTPYDFDSRYFGYLINFGVVALQKSKMGQGDAIVHIYPKNLAEIYTPLPPLPEQRAIAAALSDVDSLLTALDALITKKRLIKHGAMQELLTGKKRLPGFSGYWEVKKLGDVAEIKTGKKNNEDKVENGAYPFFVRSQNIERINSYSFDGEAILVPGEGGIGNIFHYINGKFDYHQRVYRISDFLEDTCGKFIYFTMAQHFNQQAMRNTVKATVDSLRLPTFLEFEFPSPPSLAERTAIAEILTDMDTEIAALEQRREKTRLLKKGMMQELLPGRIRLI